MSLTYAPNDWVSIYLGGIYTELEFPGQDDKQLREASITIGNLKKTPFYLSVGRKTVNFGNMQSYNPTTHSVTNHYYRTDTDDLAAEFGYLTEDWHLTFTAIDGNRQLRVADTTSSGSFGNFALSAQRNFKVCDWDVSVGAGYLNSTIYDSDADNKATKKILSMSSSRSQQVWKCGSHPISQSVPNTSTTVLLCLSS